LDALAEEQRMTDVKAKMDRLLADCDLLIIPRMSLRNVTQQWDNIPYRVHRLDETQVDAIKDFMKAGKPVLACLGPDVQSPDSMEPPTGAERDGLEDLLSRLGIHLGKQVVLFDDEAEALSDRQDRDFTAATVRVPPVEFGWKPGAGRPMGK